MEDNKFTKLELRGPLIVVIGIFLVIVLLIIATGDVSLIRGFMLSLFLTAWSAVFIITVGKFIGQRKKFRDANPVVLVSPMDALTEIYTDAQALGFDSELCQFYSQLDEYMDRYGTFSISVIKKYMEDNAHDNNLLYATLEALGTAKHNNGTHYGAIDILINYLLLSKSSRLRWGALLALTNLGDPSVIPDIEIAINNERNDTTRSVMKQTLAYLYNKRDDHEE